MNTVVKNHRLDKPADNTVYGSSWSGVTDQAPSKDAVYNKIEEIAPWGIIGWDFTDNTISDWPLYVVWNWYWWDFYSEEYTPTENKLCIMELNPIYGWWSATCSLQVKIWANRTTYDNVTYESNSSLTNKTYFSTILVKWITYRAHLNTYNSPDNWTMWIIKRKNT